MQKLLGMLYLLIFSFTVYAQNENQKAFIESCNNAINYYQNFLVKLTNGHSDFEKGKNLFTVSLKKLLTLKSLNEIDEKHFDNLKVEIENMKSLDFKTIISKDHQQSEKHYIEINGIVTPLSETSASIFLYLGLIKRDIEDFKNSILSIISSPNKMNFNVISILNNSLKFNNTYLLPYDSLENRFLAKNILHETNVSIRGDNGSLYIYTYEDKFTLNKPDNYSIFNKYIPYSIEFYFNEKRLNLCIWNFMMDYNEAQTLRNELEKKIGKGVNYGGYVIWDKEHFSTLKLVSLDAGDINIRIMRSDTTNINIAKSEKMQYSLEFAMYKKE